MNPNDKCIELIKKKKDIKRSIKRLIHNEMPANDIKNKVIELHDTIKELNELGRKFRIEIPYLQPEYWDNHTVNDYKDSMKSGDFKMFQKIDGENNINQQPVEKIVERVVEKVKYIKECNYYILNIVWSKTETNEVTSMMVDEYITNYLEYMGVKKTSDDFSEFYDRTEYNFKYSFKGSQESLNIIIDSVKYLAEKNNMDLEIYFKINKNKK